MARLFNPEIVEETIKESPIRRTTPLDFFYGCLIATMFISIVVMGLVKKKEINKDKKIMNLAELLEMDNGNILTRKVKYETSKKRDPQDTSDIFFEVVNGNEKYAKGDLVKFNHRFYNEQSFEGETYCIINTAEIQCHLKAEHVKKDILKR
jgi:hypothetical protein